MRGMEASGKEEEGGWRLIYMYKPMELSIAGVCVLEKLYSLSITSFSQPLQHDHHVLPKSRFDSLDMYLANGKYNDTEIVYDKELFQELKDGGKIDSRPCNNYRISDYPPPPPR